MEYIQQYHTTNVMLQVPMLPTIAITQMMVMMKHDGDNNTDTNTMTYC